MKERVAVQQAQVKLLFDEATLHRELRLIIGRLEEFATSVTKSLDQVDWNTQREIIRLLVKRVEVDTEQVNVVFRVGEVPELPKSEPGFLQDCLRRNFPTRWGTLRCSSKCRLVYDSRFQPGFDLASNQKC